MAIISDRRYALTGAQVEDLAARINSADSDIATLDSKIQALASDLSYKGSVEDYAHLPADASTGDVYTTVDDGMIYVWDGNAWVALNAYPGVFTGTDGGYDGAAGLVPAPLTTDAGKFLKADGTWSSVGAVPTKTSDLINDGADNTSVYVEADELAPVATSGTYASLTGKPTIVTITMTSTDPGEGAPLPANSFIAVYDAS